MFVRTRVGCLVTEAGRHCLQLPVRVQAVRIGAVLLAVGAAFILDDPAGDIVVYSPTPLWLQRFMRVLIALPPLAIAWIICLHLARTASFAPAHFPWGALTLEVTALAAVGAATSAAVAWRVLGGRAGLVAGPALLGLVGVMVALPGPRGYLLVASPASKDWGASHRPWEIVLILALATLAQFSHDPARPRIFRRQPQWQSDRHTAHPL